MESLSFGGLDGQVENNLLEDILSMEDVFSGVTPATTEENEVPFMPQSDQGLDQVQMETSGMNEEDVLNMLFKITENDDIVHNGINVNGMVVEEHRNSPAAATSIRPAVLCQNYVNESIPQASDLPDLLTEFNQIQATCTLAHQQSFPPAPPSDHGSIASHVSPTPEASTKSMNSPSQSVSSPGSNSQYLSDSGGTDSDQVSKGSPASSDGNKEEGKKQKDDQCLICGKFSGKHNYYGGQGCLSCRAFFRRTVQSKSHLNFKCSEEGRCDINSQSWRSCQACRFQKCLKAGMKASYVLNDSERKDRNRLRADNRKKRLEQQIVKARSKETKLAPPMIQLTDLFSKDDYVHVHNLLKSSNDVLLQALCKYYSQHQRAYNDMMGMLYKGSTMNKANHVAMDTFVLYCVRTFYHQFGEMALLHPRDRNKLLTKNYPHCMGLVFSNFVDAQPDTEKLSGRFIVALFEILQKEQAERDLRDMENSLNKITLSEGDTLRPIKYEQMYPDRWIEDRNAEKRHRDLFDRVKDWARDFAAGGQVVKVDEFQMWLICLIILFSTDDVDDLDDPKAVSDIQTKYATLLFRYLKAKYGQSNAKGRAKALSKFCDGMMVTSMTREMRDIKETHLAKKNESMLVRAGYRNC